MSLNTSPLDIFQASVEAIAYQYSLIYDALKPYLTADHKIFATGGAISHYPFLAQAMADVLGTTVWTSDDDEVSSRGVALLTLQRLGHEIEINTDTLESMTAYAPSVENHKLYQIGRERHQALYDKLIADGSVSVPAGG